MSDSGTLRYVTLVRTDVSEESSVAIFGMTIIGELGRTLAVNSIRRTLRRNTMRITSKKTAFFIVTAVKTSNLTECSQFTTNITRLVQNSLYFAQQIYRVLHIQGRLSRIVITASYVQYTVLENREGVEFMT
jgi:hypothetical protein